jgi:nucleoid-associated protein YgaU
MVTPGEEENGRDERESRRDRRRAKRDAEREEETDERIPPPRRPEPDDGRGLAAWGPRILAPLAFFLAATILILLVSSALDHKKTQTTSTPAANTPTAPVGNAGAGTGTVTGKPGRKFYVVKEGDTLESIAAKKNTSLEDLFTLNPGIDPTTLTPGQKIRIS